jgi:hypothetical protein
MRPARSFALALLILGSLAFAGPQPAARAESPRHAVLVTLDGVRTQEIFGGLDRDVLSSLVKDGPVEKSPIYERYGAPTVEARRTKLMPFFWDTLMRAHGSIAGNRARGSRFGVTNTQWFSYPGYSEILTGAAHDDRIDSNDNKFYPYVTVLEFLRHRLELPREGVGVFASWETFNWIAEHEAGTLTINAGYEPYESPDPVTQAWNAAQFEAQTPWDSARHDAPTFHLAMSFLQSARPRVLYIAFDETDDWAHDRNYGRLLDALHRIDGYLKDLWTWLQNDPEYRDNTVLLITVDHGRGHTIKDWFDHGREVARANETWFAAVGPDWPRRGEWTSAPDAFTNQIAATLAKALGQDFLSEVPSAGKPIDYLWGK